MSGVVFDTGALIAFDRADRAIAVLVVEARRSGDTITVPAGCVAQAWRDPRRQARIAGLLRQPNVHTPCSSKLHKGMIGIAGNGTIPT